MTETATISLPYLPPSYNTTVYAHWAKVRKLKEQLQRDLEMLMLGQVPQPVPGGFVEANALLIVPDRRRRDAGNFRTPLEKACGDALVRGGFLPDDTPAHFEFVLLAFEHVPRVRATKLTLTWETP